MRELAFCQFQTHLSAGGLVAAWQRLAEVLEPWYVQIGLDARASAVLHADETGWRMNGKTWWLWCFANKRTCYYLLDPSRGSPALEKFFAEAFDGVLVTDFWAAYNAFSRERQCCLAHLLRELEKVDQSNNSAEWKAFAKMLRRLVRDGIRLRKRADFDPQRYRSRIRRIDQRLVALSLATYADADAARLAKRLWNHTDEIFTFLDYPAVPFDNNLAERMIRPAVILRKNCQSNRSEKGAAVQAVLMSVYRTLKLRGHDPLGDDRFGPADLPDNRPTTPAAGTIRCRRVKCYTSVSLPGFPSSCHYKSRMPTLAQKVTHLRSISFKPTLFTNPGLAA